MSAATSHSPAAKPGTAHPPKGRAGRGSRAKTRPVALNAAHEAARKAAGERVSERRCIGCNQPFDKTDASLPWVRFVQMRDPSDRGGSPMLVPDLRVSHDGRGAYCLAYAGCLAKAAKRNRFAYALGGQAKLPNGDDPTNASGLTAFIRDRALARIDELAHTAARAGELTFGVDATVEAAGYGRAHFVWVSSDLSVNSRERLFRALPGEAEAEALTWLDKKNLGARFGLTGEHGAAVVCVTNPGLAERMRGMLSIARATETDPACVVRGPCELE